MKRAISLTLCLLMLLSTALLMGCGGKEESSAGADGTKPLEITWWIPVHLRLGAGQLQHPAGHRRLCRRHGHEPFHHQRGGAL